MRVFFLLLIRIFKITLSSQCLHTKIINTFNFECSTGSQIGGRISIDSVIHTASAFGAVNLLNNSYLVYKNGVIEIDGSVEFDNGDVIKIKPNLVGTCNINILSDEPGCPVTWDSDREVCIQSPLPVKWLSSPIVIIKNGESHIIWSVAYQINNEKYTIEHSNDGRSFSPIGEMEGDGTTNETKQYGYTHTSPSIGMNCYLIKQVDYDGKYSYSDMASVRYDGSGETSIYPNPATSEVTITTSEPLSTQIFDVYSRVLKIQEGQNTVEISELLTGIFIFVFEDQKYRVLKE